MIGLATAVFVLAVGTGWQFRGTMRALLAIPNKELDKELAKWRAQRKRQGRGSPS